MTLELNWFIPTDGDGRQLVHTSPSRALQHTIPGYRPPSLSYLSQVAQAAEQGGFHAALMPTGSTCVDAWLAASAMIAATRRLKFLVAFRPGFELPAYVLHKAASLQNLSGNRLLLNVVTGGSDSEQRAFGDFLKHEERYERTAEFLSLVRRLWDGPIDEHSGRYYQLEKSQLKISQYPRPPLYFGGASPAAEAVAAAHADVYLLWGEPPAMARERIQRVSERAALQGRSLRFGIRLHVIGRDTADEAWAEADRLLSGVSDEAIAEAQQQLKASASVGQARMLSLNSGKRGQSVRDLEIHPNLWAGIGLVRSGAGTALVGSYAQIAERILEYQSIGLDTFILSGYPNLEEALRVGEEILPLVRSKQTNPMKGVSSPLRAEASEAFVH